MTNNVGLSYDVTTIYRDLQVVLNKIVRIGNTKYHIECRYQFSHIYILTWIEDVEFVKQPVQTQDIS